MSSVFRLVSSSLLGTVFVVAWATGGCARAPLEEGSTPSLGEAVASSEVAPAQLQVNEKGQLRNIWWNQEAAVSRLELSETQRQEMDAAFHRFLSVNPGPTTPGIWSQNISRRCGPETGSRPGGSTISTPSS